MAKSHEMEYSLNEIAKVLFKRERNSMACVTCGSTNLVFRDNLSVRDYLITHMCQECQDETFESSRNMMDKDKEVAISSIHTCCGCSCHICDNDHSEGFHSSKCKEKIYQRWDEAMRHVMGAEYYGENNV